MQTILIPNRTPPSRDAAWRPTPRPTPRPRNSLMKVSNQGFIEDVASGDPGAFLGAVSLPVDEVLETPSSPTNIQKLGNRESFSSIDEPWGRRIGWGRGVGGQDNRLNT